MYWRDLEVWKKAHGFVLDIYKLTTQFPKHKKYELIDQLRRTSYSVPANIVEGQSRNSTKEYLYFLYNARRSVEQVRYFLLLSKELEYISNNIYQKFETEYETVSKMLNGLIKSLKT